MVALPGVFTTAGGEVQPAEEQRAFGKFTQIPGLAAQSPAEHFGVGTGGGDVLTGDDLLLGAVDHRGEAGPAGSWWARSRLRERARAGSVDVTRPRIPNSVTE